MPETSPIGHFSLYTTMTCGSCWIAKHWLTQHGIVKDQDYTEIMIDEDESAARRVEEINHGYRSVPTFVFEDGSVLTEPSLPELMAYFAASVSSSSTML